MIAALKCQTHHIQTVGCNFKKRDDMTIKEAILQSLEDLKGTPANYMLVLEHINKKNYYDFKDAKTPASTIAALLGDFIRLGDSRVKRIKGEGGTFLYYLTKFEKEIDIENVIVPATETKSRKKEKTYQERDLHLLLSSYLKNQHSYSKTIFHEKSTGNDNHQKWIHPDMVGINFINLQSKSTQTLLKVINNADTFKISSYEIKKEINTDYELKKTFFQTVSNSSWANYGYLVAFEISDSLNEEIERLSQSFGIGVIELKANPFESKILFPSKYKELDIKTIDKLCKINKDFERFIEQVEKLLTASERYIKATERELNDFCDKYLTNDTEIEKYCIEKNIPIEKAAGNNV